MTDESVSRPHREEAATELNAQALALAGCTACRLHERRTQVVFGVGDPVADLMFVGEGPGFHEDRLGEPFVGQAGKLLTELLATIGLRREDVYIANVVKCRPPENRDPLPDEIDACRPNLVAQIQSIRPRVICTLGRFATRLVAETDAGISSIRGRAKQMEVAGVPVAVLPVFHPAAALYTPSNRAVLEEDFQRLRVLLDLGARALKSEVKTEPAPTGPEPPSMPAPRVVEAPDPVASPAADEEAPPTMRPSSRPSGQLPLW